MSKAIIEIELDNDALTERGELVRILAKLASDVASGVWNDISSLRLWDINGNQVGTFKIVDTTDF